MRVGETEKEGREGMRSGRDCAHAFAAPAKFTVFADKQRKHGTPNHPQYSFTQTVASLKRPADAAVLADAPEMDRDQESRRQWNGDAMQHVEAQERVAANKTAAQKGEAGVASRMNQ